MGWRVEAMADRVQRWIRSNGRVAVFFDGAYHLQRGSMDDSSLFGNYGRRRLVGIYDSRATRAHIIEDLEFAARHK